MKTGARVDDDARSLSSRVATGPGLRYLATIAGIAVVYLAAAKFGLSLAFATKQVSAVWPPTGIALAAYLWFGYRAWPGVYLGAFLLNATSNEPLATAAGIAVGNTLAGVVGVFLLRRLVGFDKSLERFRDVLGLVVVGAAVACAVSATNGVAHLALAGIVPWSAYGSVWWVWWAGDALGVLLFAPFVLMWALHPVPSWRGWRLVELGALFLALAAMCHVAFSGEVARTTALFRFEYTVFPFIIWAALRFGQREAASAVILIAAFAIWGAIHDRGPFALGTLDGRLILLEVFMAVTAVTALTLGAVTAEREHAERALREAHDELEARVEERTAELATANREKEILLKEIHHRVKNNLQVVASLFYLQRERLPDQHIQSLLDEARSRVESIALIHDQLYHSADLTFIDLPDYLVRLSSAIRSTYGAGGVAVQADAPGIVLDMEAAVPCGLLVSELLTNSLKHAFPQRRGRVAIRARREGGQEIVLEVEDDGVGIPESLDWRSAPSLGLQLVQRLTKQLRGTIDLDRSSGTRFTIRFSGKVSTDPRREAGMNALAGAGPRARPTRRQ